MGLDLIGASDRAATGGLGGVLRRVPGLVNSVVDP